MRRAGSPRAFAVGRVIGGVRGKAVALRQCNGQAEGAAAMRYAAAIAQRPGVTESDP